MPFPAASITSDWIYHQAVAKTSRRRQANLAVPAGSDDRPRPGTAATRCGPAFHNTMPTRIPAVSRQPGLPPSGALSDGCRTDRRIPAEPQVSLPTVLLQSVQHQVRVIALQRGHQLLVPPQALPRPHQ